MILRRNTTPDPDLLAAGALAAFEQAAGDLEAASELYITAELAAQAEEVEARARKVAAAKAADRAGSQAARIRQLIG